MTVVQYEEDLERAAEGGAGQCVREEGEREERRERKREGECSSGRCAC